MTPRLVTCSACKLRGHSSATCPDHAKRALHYLRMVDAQLDPARMSAALYDAADWVWRQRDVKAALALVERGDDLQRAAHVIGMLVDDWPKWRDGVVAGFPIAPLHLKHTKKAAAAVSLLMQQRVMDAARSR